MDLSHNFLSDVSSRLFEDMICKSINYIGQNRDVFFFNFNICVFVFVNIQNKFVLI